MLSGLLPISCSRGLSVPHFTDIDEDARAAAGINLQAEILAATAEAELLSSRKRLHDVMAGRSGVDPSSGSNNTNSNSKPLDKHSPRQPSAAAAPQQALVQVQDCRGRQGLRGFAMSVCNTIQARGRTTYNEVADELVEELRDDPTEPAGDDKNIRRRVPNGLPNQSHKACMAKHTGPIDPPPTNRYRCQQHGSLHGHRAAYHT